MLKRNPAISIVLALALLFICQFADAASRIDLEIQEHITTLTSGTLAGRIRAAKIITRSGYQSQKLFQVVEKELLDNYQDPRGSQRIDYVAWLCKALASSGQENYRATLSKIAHESTNHKVQHYARQSVDLLQEYAQRAKDINSQKNVKEGRDPEVTRLMNMLQSDLMKMKSDAAKIIIRQGWTDPDLFVTVNEELLAGFAEAHDRYSVDAMSWLCKALANSQNPEHRKTLEKVAQEAKSAKLQKYAKKSLQMM